MRGALPKTLANRVGKEKLKELNKPITQKPRRNITQLGLLLSLRRHYYRSVGKLEPLELYSVDEALKVAGLR